ncbi:nodulin-related protein 1-like [Solanum dulcamara]|uniref:nodulin-related protein 1-like n=1 Tax=Solanum dulcamara TaxID=45834 RepID=UPI0024856946|nr:nodulin-related protein 1-like [Solanum dulcamara]
MDPTQSKTTSGSGYHSSTQKPKSHPKPSKSELMSSAKLVANAAKSKLHHDPKQFEKSELAGAAADLINAASQYGKLEETGIGKFTGKAESYLHKYETSHHSTTAGAAYTTGHTQTSGHTGDGKHESGYGEYIKMAEGLLKKHSDGTQSSGSGNKGEYLKMAGDFLKKH